MSDVNIAYSEINYSEVSEIKETCFNNASHYLDSSFPLGELTLLTLNVRSLDKNFSSLLIFVERLKFKPDIIVCTETWQIKHLYLYNICDYDIYCNESTINQNDGVVVYVKRCIHHLAKIEKIEYCKFLSIFFKLGTHQVTVSAIYRCHFLPKQIFIDILNKFLLKYQTDPNHFITGDFNIDLISKNVFSENYLNNFLQSGYKPYFNGPTRPNRSSELEGTCVQLFC